LNDPFTDGCGSATVTINVSAGVVPQFDWTPGCALWSLQVSSSTGSRDVTIWQTLTLVKNELRPPVTYGVHQAGAEDPLHYVAPELTPGSTYQVTLFVLPTQSSVDPRIAGSRMFTP
jgi:hypothetical protein